METHPRRWLSSVRVHLAATVRYEWMSAWCSPDCVWRSKVRTRRLKVQARYVFYLPSSTSHQCTLWRRLQQLLLGNCSACMCWASVKWSSRWLDRRGAWNAFVLDELRRVVSMKLVYVIMLILYMQQLLASNRWQFVDLLWTMSNLIHAVVTRRPQLSLRWCLCMSVDHCSLRLIFRHWRLVLLIATYLRKQSLAKIASIVAQFKCLALSSGIGILRIISDNQS